MYCDIGSNSFPNPPWFTSKSTLSAKIWRNKQKTITVEEILFWVSAACCRSCRAGVPPARDTKNAPRNPPASPPERDKTSLTLDSEYLRSHLHPGKKWFHSMSKHSHLWLETSSPFCGAYTTRVSPPLKVNSKSCPSSPSIARFFLSSKNSIKDAWMSFFPWKDCTFSCFKKVLQLGYPLWN